jgi:hypothetical protein
MRLKLIGVLRDELRFIEKNAYASLAAIRIEVFLMRVKND